MRAAVIGGSTADVLACPCYGMASVCVVFAGSGSTYTFTASKDGGLNYDINVRMENIGLGTVGTSGVGVFYYEGGLPAGVTNFRVGVSAAVSPGLVTIMVSPAVFRTQMTVAIASGQTISLTGTGNRIGQVGAASIQNDETTTPLAGSGSAVGASRDLTTTASGSVGVATTFFKEFRGFSFADVAGTLFLAVSQDNVTFRRVQSIAATAVGVVFQASFTYAPVLRYARVEYDNGVAAQSYFALATTRMAD